MDIRVLDHPLDRKDLAAFAGPGVYLFLPEKKKKVTDKILCVPDLLRFLREEIEVCYVGKAKRLNQRLQSYRVASASSSGDWYKRGKLSEIAKSVLVVQTPSHFEACLLELLLIRLLDPTLNYMSTRPGKLFYVQQSLNSNELCAASRRRAGFKTWGCVRVKSELRLAFDAFQEIIDFYDPNSGTMKIRPADSGFGRAGGVRRLSLRMSEKHLLWVQNVLRGKKQGLMDSLWREMRLAASQQQFHYAAHLRDLFLALRQLQVQLRRSRKIMRHLRANRFVIGCSDSGLEREYVLRQYTLIELALKPGCLNSDSASFAELMRLAIDLFKSEMTGLSQSERLRVNFEFLRLMLWWLEHQPEECLTRSARNI